MSKRAAIYARVSTDDQRGNYSIPTQIQDCLKLILKRGYKLVGDRFVDPQSGQDTQPSKKAVKAFVDDYTSRELSRPGLDASLMFLESEGFDVVIVHAIDRLARDPYIRQTLEREFQKRGAQVEYVLGNYEDSPEGEVRKDLDATFAKWENAKRTERVTRGKNGKAERGLYVAGRAPFGYRIDQTAVGGLRVHLEEAEIVRRIFSLYLTANHSIRGIRNSLNLEGIKTYFGGKWAKSTVRNILMNETYAGSCYYNRRKRTSRTLLKMRDPKEWITIPTTPIIDRQTWKATQNKLDKNRLERRNASTRFYLLGGMVYCADCKRVYSAETKPGGRHRRIHDTAFYRHRVKEGHCHNKTVGAKGLDERVWSEVVKVILDPEHLRKGYQERLDNLDSDVARQREHSETLKVSLVKLEAKRDNLTKAYIDPDIRMLKAEYVIQREKVDEEILDLRKQIVDAENEMAIIPTIEQLESLEAFAEEMRWLLSQSNDPTREEKRRILQMLHVKVWLTHDGEPKVIGWYTPKSDRLSDTTSS